MTNEAPTQALSYNFYKIFKNNYFLEHLRKTAPNDIIIIIRFCCKFYGLLKRKVQEYQK